MKGEKEHNKQQCQNGNRNMEHRRCPCVWLGGRICEVPPLSQNQYQFNAQLDTTAHKAHKHTYNT